MAISSSPKSADHLMHLIATRNGDVPNFSLLLGSGASVTSGVKTAQEMIEEWRALLAERYGLSTDNAEDHKQFPNLIGMNMRMNTLCYSKRYLTSRLKGVYSSKSA